MDALFLLRLYPYLNVDDLIGLTFILITFRLTSDGLHWCRVAGAHCCIIFFAKHEGDQVDLNAVFYDGAMQSLLICYTKNYVEV